MKKFFENGLKMGALTALSLSLMACMGTTQISQHIDRTGKIELPENVIFPDLDKAWQKQGQFPNSENLAKIRAGIAKDELFQLIGRPHFSEAHKAREWDYIMKFYRPDESVQICQYKVIFDQDYKGQSFYWKPADCIHYVKPLTPETPVAPPVMTALPVVNEKINVSADALFYFDKYQRQDMLPKGQSELNSLAEKLRTYQQQGRMQVMITGHTDRFGNEMYNMNLSLLRAQTIRHYLIERGIEAGNIWATGAGESQPIKYCDDSLAKAQAIECLQPNRRVEVHVSVYR